MDRISSNREKLYRRNEKGRRRRRWEPKKRGDSHRAKWGCYEIAKTLTPQSNWWCAKKKRRKFVLTTTIFQVWLKNKKNTFLTSFKYFFFCFLGKFPNIEIPLRKKRKTKILKDTEKYFIRTTKSWEKEREKSLEKLQRSHEKIELKSQIWYQKLMYNWI